MDKSDLNEDLTKLKVTAKEACVKWQERWSAYCQATRELAYLYDELNSLKTDIEDYREAALEDLDENSDEYFDTVDELDNLEEELWDDNVCLDNAIEAVERAGHDDD